jgi:hypothetical protein
MEEKDLQNSCRGMLRKFSLGLSSFSLLSLFGRCPKFPTCDYVIQASCSTQLNSTRLLSDKVRSDKAFIILMNILINLDTVLACQILLLMATHHGTPMFILAPRPPRPLRTLRGSVSSSHPGLGIIKSFLRPRPPFRHRISSTNYVPYMCLGFFVAGA